MIRTFSGFLGLPSDWNLLPWPHEPYVREETNPESDVLVGYSMGGRLALGELLERRFRAAVIVSAGLNLSDPAERAARRGADERWASRFETEPWQDLMDAWDAQPVFGGHRVPRREADYDRTTLAQQLRRFSPGVMEPVEARLPEIETPVLWIAGEHDAKYADVARRAVAGLRSAELWICPAAGHRVPWEQPDAFVARLRHFLELH